MNNTFKDVFVLFVFVIQTGYCLPQGFFSQAFTVPNVVLWNSNERSLAILPNVKVSSPIKNSFNIFGKKNTVDKKPKKDQIQNNELGQFSEEFKPDQNLPIKNQKEIAEESNNIQGIKLPNDLKGEEQLISKFSDIDDNAPDDINASTEVTTELDIETTTDIYETTTLELLNRASGQLVASLLG